MIKHITGNKTKTHPSVPLKTAKRKRTNNDLQNIHIKPKDRVTRTSLKPGLNSGVQEGLEIPAPLVAPVVLVYNFNLID
jgi:hypothetical protein